MSLAIKLATSLAISLALGLVVSVATKHVALQRS